jgi:hypothetical protein
LAKASAVSRQSNCAVQGLAFRIQDAGCRLWGEGPLFRVWGVDLKVWTPDFRVQGSRFEGSRMKAWGGAPA